MNLTIAGWKQTTALLLVSMLPLQDFDSALQLVENYLSSVGGWVPDDTNNPTGPGVPATGETPEQAVDSIVQEQLGRMYDVDATVTVELNVRFFANLLAGQSDSSVLSAIDQELQNLITAQLSPTDLTATAVTSTTATIVNSGLTDQTIRLDLNTQVQTVNRLTDPKALALEEARDRFALDDTWNVSQFYTQANDDLVFFVEKYDNNAYVLLDAASTEKFILKFDSVSYDLVSGIKLPV